VHSVQSVGRGATCTLFGVLGRPAVQTTIAARNGLATPHAEVALAFEHVSKTFPDGTQALDDVTLDVAAGEMVAIVGPSGCGKSTLLRLASRLTSPSGGEIHVGQGNLGYVFQDATLLPWRTVQSNVELLAELSGVPKAERARLAADAIALTGLSGFENHRPRALSGGMRMRVSLARSLTMRPRIFLFDEPFGAVDEITRERLNGELLGLFEREQFAGLFVTHSVSEAAFLASRVVVLSPRPGRIVTELSIPFRYPRAPELRFDPAFAALAGQISARLRANLT
jgi:NitT/TauT family transport system ATP-binding protein